MRELAADARAPALSFTRVAPALSTLPSPSPNATFSHTGHVREQCVVLEHGVDGRGCRAGVLAPSWPSEKISTGGGCSNPAIMRSVVVLPQPRRAPAATKNSASPMSKFASSTAGHRLGEVGGVLGGHVGVAFTGAGPTLVISPLLALMRDQITAASRAGLVAVTVNSSNRDDWDDTLGAVAGGGVDVVLISPERLANPEFAARSAGLLDDAGLIVIDEAHCISDWGFDFRPDYQRISRLLTAARPPGAGHHRHRQPAGDRRRRHQLGTSTVTSAAPSPGVPAACGRPASRALVRTAWVADAPSTPSGPGSSTASPSPRPSGPRRVPAPCGHRRRAYSGQTRPAERARVEEAVPADHDGASSPPRRWAWGTTSPTRVRDPRRLTCAPRGLLPADRAERAGPSTTPWWSCSPPRPTSGSGSTSTATAMPPSPRSSETCSRHALDRGRGQHGGRTRGAGQPAPGAPRGPAEGARRRRRGGPRW